MSLRQHTTVTDRAQRPARPAVAARAAMPADTATGDVLQLQRAFGNRAVTQLQRQPLAGGELDSQISDTINRSRGGGHPLPDHVRGSMESAFQSDFGGVRIHTDQSADTLNRAVQAKAFTLGNDIYFRKGNYQPGHANGQELLAHELTHVVQQGGAAMSAHNRASGAQAKLTVGPVGDRYEQEADRVAKQVVQHQSVTRPAAGPGHIQRQMIGAEFDDEIFEVETAKRRAQVANLQGGKINANDPRRQHLTEFLNSDSRKGNKNYPAKMPAAGPRRDRPAAELPASTAVLYLDPGGVSHSQTEFDAETVRRAKADLLGKLQLEYAPLSGDPTLATIALTAFNEAQTALGRIFAPAENKPGAATLQPATTRGQALVQGFSQKVRNLHTRSEEAARQKKTTEEHQADLQKMNEEAAAAHAERQQQATLYRNANLDRTVEAEWALEQAANTVHAQFILDQILKPLKYNHAQADYVLKNIKGQPLQQSVAESLGSTFAPMPYANLTWAVAQAHGDMTAFATLLRLAKEPKVATALLPLLTTLAGDGGTSVEWAVWARTLFDNRYDPADVVDLYTNLHTAGVSNADIRAVPDKAKADLAGLVELNDEMKVRAYIRLAKQATNNKLTTPKEKAEKAQTALGHVKNLKVPDKTRFIKYLSYPAINADKLGDIGRAQVADENFYKRLEPFIRYKGKLPNADIRDWRTPAPTIVHTFAVGTANVSLSQNRLAFFKNRHNYSNFDFDGAKAKNTFFPTEKTDTEMFGTLQSILTSAGQATLNGIPLGGYHNIAPGGLQVGVENYNGTRFVTHFQTETGVTYTEAELNKIRPLLIDA